MQRETERQRTHGGVGCGERPCQGLSKKLRHPGSGRHRPEGPRHFPGTAQPEGSCGPTERQAETRDFSTHPSTPPFVPAPPREGAWCLQTPGQPHTLPARELEFPFFSANLRWQRGTSVPAAFTPPFRVGASVQLKSRRAFLRGLQFPSGPAEAPGAGILQERLGPRLWAPGPLLSPAWGTRGAPRGDQLGKSCRVQAAHQHPTSFYFPLKPAHS